MNEREIAIGIDYAFDMQAPSAKDVITKEEFDALPMDEVGVFEQLIAQSRGLVEAPQPTMWMKITRVFR